MTLLRKNPKKRGIIDNFRPNTLLNAELHIFTRVLTKCLVRVVDKLVGEA